MNYEELYDTLQAGNKALKDSLALGQRVQKTVAKDAQSGDVKDIYKCMEQLESSIAGLQQAQMQLRAALEGFDSAAYFQNGDFVKQMLEECAAQQVDVQGEFPVFEMFPLKVRIDADNQELVVNRKKMQCMRPKSLVEAVKKDQEKLFKGNFNAASFAAELAKAYDMAIVQKKKRPGSELYLMDLYNYLVPMARSRKEYDKQAYAFDLSRLWMSDNEELRDGRRYQFGPSREEKKSIRITNREGKEAFITTIQFI